MLFVDNAVNRVSHLKIETFCLDAQYKPVISAIMEGACTASAIAHAALPALEMVTVMVSTDTRNRDGARGD
jgi:hypothetical protein